MKIASRFFTMAMLFALGSCDQNKTSNIGTNNLATSENEMLGELSAIKSKIAILEESNSAILKLSSTGFRPLQTNIGTITMQLKRLSANGSGTQASLVIGNPTSATISELKIVGKWGMIDKDGNIDPSTAHNFATNFTQPIPRASWTNVHFNIDGARPTDIGYIEVDAATMSEIQLYGKN